MPLARHVGGKLADLAVGDLAGRARVLARNAARGPALLEKARFVHHQHAIRLGEGLNHIVTHHIAQSIRVPQRPAEQRLLTPGTRIGPGSPAASALIQPVLRRSAPSKASRNRPAETAMRSCWPCAPAGTR